jgi:hypothetical protein
MAQSAYGIIEIYELQFTIGTENPVKDYLWVENINVE